MDGRDSIADARRELPRLVREAESGQTVGWTRRGEPVAVLIGHRSFERPRAGRVDFTQACRRFAAEVDVSKLAIDPDALFTGARREASRQRDGVHHVGRVE